MLQQPATRPSEASSCSSKADTAHPGQLEGDQQLRLPLLPCPRGAVYRPRDQHHHDDHLSSVTSHRPHRLRRRRVWAAMHCRADVHCSSAVTCVAAHGSLAEKSETHCERISQSQPRPKCEKEKHEKRLSNTKL